MAGAISTLGVGSGLKLNDILDQLRAVDEEVITTKKDEVTALKTQLTEFDTVKSKLLSMKSNALSLSLSSSYLTRKASSSDEKVVTPTVYDGAATGKYAITVDRLASKSSWLSAGMAGTDSVVHDSGVDGTFKYSINGTTVTVTVPTGTTLTDLADLINEDDDNPGVTASIINDGSGSNAYKLMIKADETGSDHSLTLLAVPSLMAMTRQEADAASLNAKFSFDGLSYQRQTNTVDDVLPGAVFALEGEGDATVSVESDTTATTTMIKDLVSAYNELVQEIQDKIAYDQETEQTGILSGTTLRSLPFDLQNLMTSANPADASQHVTSLFDIGLEFNRDGTITLDEEVLDQMVADYPDSVQAFFVGDPDNDITGFADLVNEQLRTLTSTSGLVEAEKSAAQSKIDDLELQITSETERIDKKYELMTKQFIELDRYMKQMTSIGDYLTSQFNSLSNLTEGNNSQ